MGCLPSTFRRKKRWQPAICALAEQELRQLVTPPEATDALGRTALHCAAEAGDEAEARRLLAEGASVRATDERGRTPLVVAASAGGAGLCEVLVDAGADVGARDCLGRTALHAAAEDGGDGAATVVKLLLRRGANPHAQDGCGRSALHCALQARNLPVAEELVPAVGPLLLPDDTGKTELHWAAAKGTPEMVRQLIARTNGDVADRDEMGMTALARALQAYNREAAQVLVMEAWPSESAVAPDVFGNTVLQLAAYAGYPEVVRHLVQRGLSPWVVDTTGRDSLLWAVESGERQVVEEILDRGGYQECVDTQGLTALHVAAIRGDAAIAALLLERGADASRADLRGRTPLMYALRGAYEEAAFLLATRGPVYLRQRDHQKRTLLHWAAVGGDTGAVWELLARGARVNAMDAQGKTAAALAVEHGNEEAAALLVDADGFRVTFDNEGRSPLHGAAAAGWSQVALKMVLQGADPHECDNDMVSPVTLAIGAGHYSLARAIARAGWIFEQLVPFS